MDLAAGSRVGNLVIERLIGQGGYGRVYLARDTLIDRVVAAKVLPPLPDAERQAFLSEAHLIGQLRSPHVVTLYQVHQLRDGGWLLEMEMVDGGSVADHLADRASLPLPMVLRIARQVLAALAEAHRLGIVHRDIKPANVLLTEAGDAKLADFGLAIRAARATRSSGDQDSFVGTPSFMAPEVMMGGAPSPAADLWSLGVLLFRMVNGNLPFSGATLHQMFVAVHNAAPAPLGAHVPPELAHAIACCLAKGPADRPESADDVLALLDRVAHDDSVRIARRRRLPSDLPRLHGRTDEIASAHALLEGVQRTGRAGTLALTGEAGLGKTALLNVVKAMSLERGFRWIELDLAGGHGLVREFVAALRRFREREPDLTPFRPESYTAATWRAVSALLEETLEPGGETAWALESVLSEFARNGPLCFVVDDAHEADRHEASLLQVLVRRLPGDPVLFAFALRVGGETSPLERMLADDIRGRHRLDLGPLDRDAIYRVLQDAAGGAEVDGAVTTRIASLSEGNPLLATELLRYFEAEGAVARDDSRVFEGEQWHARRVPERFRRMAIQRLSGLDERDREMLDVAAVDGIAFDGEAVAAVVQRPLLQALRALQALCRRPGLLTAGEAGFRFAHALLREAAYDALSPEYRRALHRALAQHFVEREGELDPERIGVHWENAGEPERAAPFLRRATVAAARRQDLRRAIDLSVRAGLVPGRIETSAAHEHADVLLELVHCYADAGLRDDESALYEVLLRAAEEAGDETLRIQTIASRSYSRYYVDGPSAVDSEAVRKVAELPPATRIVGRAHYLLGVVAKDRGRLDDAVTHLERAERTWAELGLDGQRSSAVNELALVAEQRGHSENAERLFGEAARLSERVGRLVNAAISHVNRVRAARERGVTEGLVETLERSIRTLRLEGVSHVAGHVGNILAGARISGGDLDGALRAITAAYDDLAGSSFLHALSDLRITHASILGMRGRLGEAWKHVAEARENIGRSERARASLQLAEIELHLLCWGGDLDAAAKTAREALAVAGDHDPRARADLATSLAKATLVGLPASFAREGLALLAVEPGAFGTWAEAVVAGAVALGDETENARGWSDRLLAPDVSHEVTESRILGRWLAAEAERRSGRRDWAAREARGGLHAARDFGHVWLQAALLRYLEALTGDATHRGQREAIVAAAGADLDDAGAERLRAAWLSSPTAGG